MPNEDAVMAALSSNLHEPAFYLFPGEGMESGKPTEEQMRRWQEKYRRGPTGVIVFQPSGREFGPGLFLTELAGDIAGALLAAFLFAAAVGSLSSFVTRVLFVGAWSLVASADVQVSYWNWYRFPTNYTLATVADGFIGWLLVGAVLALIIKPEAR